MFAARQQTTACRQNIVSGFTASDWRQLAVITGSLADEARFNVFYVFVWEQFCCVCPATVSILCIIKYLDVGRMLYRSCIYGISDDFKVSVKITNLLFSRDSIICYSSYMPSAVRPSVTRVDHTKTVEVRIMKFSPYGSPIPLVFQQQVSSRNSEGFPQSGGVKWGWGS